MSALCDESADQRCDHRVRFNAHPGTSAPCGAQLQAYGSERTRGPAGQNCTRGEDREVRALQDHASLRRNLSASELARTGGIGRDLSRCLVPAVQLHLSSPIPCLCPQVSGVYCGSVSKSHRGRCSPWLSKWTNRCLPRFPATIFTRSNRRSIALLSYTSRPAKPGPAPNATF